ncbi:MAG TPA: hypothetical protein V6C76_10535 [Drouetiella sp.]
MDASVAAVGADLAEQFLSLFSARGDSLIRNAEAGSWRRMSQFHLLTDDEILAALSDASNVIRAVSFERTTRYAALGLPEHSPYLELTQFRRLTDLLASLGLRPRVYKASGANDIQLFMYLVREVKCVQVQESLTKVLSWNGFPLRSDRLLVYPGDGALTLPLQRGFAWLNEDLQPIVSRVEIALDSAIALFCSEVSRYSSDFDRVSDAAELLPNAEMTDAEFWGVNLRQVESDAQTEFDTTASLGGATNVQLLFPGSRTGSWQAEMVPTEVEDLADTEVASPELETAQADSAELALSPTLVDGLAEDFAPDSHIELEETGKSEHNSVVIPLMSRKHAISIEAHQTETVDLVVEESVENLLQEHEVESNIEAPVELIADDVSQDSVSQESLIASVHEIFATKETEVVDFPEMDMDEVNAVLAQLHAENIHDEEIHVDAVHHVDSPHAYDMPSNNWETEVVQMSQWQCKYGSPSETDEVYVVQDATPIQILEPVDPKDDLEITWSFEPLELRAPQQAEVVMPEREISEDVAPIHSEISGDAASLQSEISKEMAALQLEISEDVAVLQSEISEEELEEEAQVELNPIPESTVEIDELLDEDELPESLPISQQEMEELSQNIEADNDSEDSAITYRVIADDEITSRVHADTAPSDDTTDDDSDSSDVHSGPVQTADIIQFKSKQSEVQSAGEDAEPDWLFENAEMIEPEIEREAFHHDVFDHYDDSPSDEYLERESELLDELEESDEDEMRFAKPKSTESKSQNPKSFPLWLVEEETKVEVFPVPEEQEILEEMIVEDFEDEEDEQVAASQGQNVEDQWPRQSSQLLHLLTDQQSDGQLDMFSRRNQTRDPNNPNRRRRPRPEDSPSSED